ncbi:Catalytic/ hydrolase [Zea mays]|uniref:Catalytic/ hydrolase n=1 Tax=Zea mays TaxID=4577 RepID=A0A1D6N6L1_MAIZE|nr:Catalytic/ hydrolase [Zea mays]
MAASLRASSSLRSRLLSFSSGCSLCPWRLLLSSPVHSDAPHQTETLAFDEIQLSPEKPATATAFVLHGLLGSGRNWRSFSRALVSELRNRSPSDEWRMVLVDLRNHGRSAGIKGLGPPHNISTAAKDLADLVKARGWPWPDVVVGHSMGGKVALDFAESCSRGVYGDSANLPKQLLRATRWVVDHMLSLGFSKSLSEWIGSNLKKDNDHVTWAFNLQAAIDMFSSYRERDYWSVLEHPPKDLEIAIVQAEHSDRWVPDDVQRLKALAGRESKPDVGKVSLHVLPNSGHWVHVDNPKGLLEIMVPNFLSAVQN